MIQLDLAAIELHQVCKEKLEARKWGVIKEVPSIFMPNTCSSFNIICNI